MPTFPKFEDWEAPWDKEGAEDFDASRAKGLLYQFAKKASDAGEKLVARDAAITTLTTERDEAVTKVSAFEEKDLTEVEKLRRQVEQLSSRKPESDTGPSIAEARLSVALEKGLTKAQAARLVGTTEEELTADADALLTELGIASGDGGGDGGRQTPARRVVNGRLRSGLERDAEDDGDEFDPGKLVAGLQPSKF